MKSNTQNTPNCEKYKYSDLKNMAAILNLAMIFVSINIKMLKI